MITTHQQSQIRLLLDSLASSKQFYSKFPVTAVDSMNIDSYEKTIMHCIKNLYGQISINSSFDSPEPRDHSARFKPFHVNHLVKDVERRFHVVEFNSMYSTILAMNIDFHSNLEKQNAPFWLKNSAPVAFNLLYFDKLFSLLTFGRHYAKNIIIKEHKDEDLYYMWRLLLNFTYGALSSTGKKVHMLPIKKYSVIRSSEPWYPAEQARKIGEWLSNTSGFVSANVDTLVYDTSINLDFLLNDLRQTGLSGSIIENTNVCHPKTSSEKIISWRVKPINNSTQNIIKF